MCVHTHSCTCARVNTGHGRARRRTGCLLVPPLGKSSPVFQAWGQAGNCNHTALSLSARGARGAFLRLAVPGEKRGPERDPRRPRAPEPRRIDAGASGALVNEAARPLQCAGPVPARRPCDPLEDKIIAPRGGTKTSMGFCAPDSQLHILTRESAWGARRQVCGDEVVLSRPVRQLRALGPRRWRPPQSCPGPGMVVALCACL